MPSVDEWARGERFIYLYTIDSGVYNAFEYVIRSLCNFFKIPYDPLDPSRGCDLTGHMTLDRGVKSQRVMTFPITGGPCRNTNHAPGSSMPLDIQIDLQALYKQ